MTNEELNKALVIPEDVEEFPEEAVKKDVDLAINQEQKKNDKLLYVIMESNSMERGFKQYVSMLTTLGELLKHLTETGLDVNGKKIYMARADGRDQKPLSANEDASFKQLGFFSGSDPYNTLLIHNIDANG